MPAVVAGDAGAEEVLAEPNRVGRLEVADQLVVAAVQDSSGRPPRCARCPPSPRPRAAARRGPAASDPHDARQQQPGADPVGQDLELGARGRAGSAAGLASRWPWPATARPRPTRKRLPKVASRMRRDQVDARPDRREQMEDQPVDQRDRDEGRPHPRAAQPPADPGRPEALLSIHWPQSSLRGVAELWVAQLGTVPYREGVALQESSASAGRRGELPDLLLVLEHPPVYTKGKRTEPADLPMGEDWYRAQGIDVCDTDRGGRVTYHGPGQLVAYPIMGVERVAEFVHTMEGAIVSALADEGIAAEARDDALHRRLGGRLEDRLDRGAGVRRRDDARARRERRQRPAAVRVDRAVRDRPRAHDLRVEGDRRARRCPASASGWRGASRRRSAGGSGIVSPRRILEREPVPA